MEQILHHRGITYVVGIETDGVRAWAVRGGPDGAEVERIQASGVARARGLRGSFKGAVMAARDAIDEMLGVDSLTDAVPKLDPSAAALR